MHSRLQGVYSSTQFAIATWRTFRRSPRDWPPQFRCLKNARSWTDTQATSQKASKADLGLQGAGHAPLTAHLALHIAPGCPPGLWYAHSSSCTLSSAKAPSSPSKRMYARIPFSYMPTGNLRVTAAGSEDQEMRTALREGCRPGGMPTMPSRPYDCWHRRVAGHAHAAAGLLAHLSFGLCRLSSGSPKPNIVKSMPRTFCIRVAAGMVLHDIKHWSDQ